MEPPLEFGAGLDQPFAGIMSFRLEMLQVARLAPQLLGDAAELVRAFLHRQTLDSGAFPDRDGRADLYYTVFGMEALLALHTEPDWPRLAEWLASFGRGGALDFIHLCCLARCWSAVPENIARLPDETRTALLDRIIAFQTPDGGFHQRRGATRCTAYGCLLGAVRAALAGFTEALYNQPFDTRLVGGSFRLRQSWRA